MNILSINSIHILYILKVPTEIMYNLWYIIGFFKFIWGETDNFTSVTNIYGTPILREEIVTRFTYVERVLIQESNNEEQRVNMSYCKCAAKGFNLLEYI